jgi:surface polysaccharide O-acyltransferase-like enzyme
MLDRETSLRLNLLRFPLIIGVVFIHSYNSTVGLSGGDVGVSQPGLVVDFLRNFISQGLARVAVPLFFLMSGYLFFYGFKWSKESYWAKLRTRIRTLLIPFLFWNIATLLVFALAQSIPATQIYFSGKNPRIEGFSSFDYLNAIIGLTGDPIAYQFWFVRDLIILVLLAPFVSITNKVAPFPFLSIVLMCWLVQSWPVLAPSSEASLFFSLGAYLGSRERNLFVGDKFGKIIVLLYVTLVTFDAFSINESFNLYLHKLGIILGILAALFLTKPVAKTQSLRTLLLRLGSASFFVYATHEPLLMILKKVLYKVISPDTSYLILALYFFIPIVILVFTVVVYFVLAGLAPRFVSIVTGGRVNERLAIVRTQNADATLAQFEQVDTTSCKQG